MFSIIEYAADQNTYALIIREMFLEKSSFKVYSRLLSRKKIPEIIKRVGTQNLDKLL